MLHNYPTNWKLRSTIVIFVQCALGRSMGIRNVFATRKMYYREGKTVVCGHRLLISFGRILTPWTHACHSGRLNEFFLCYKKPLIRY